MFRKLRIFILVTVLIFVAANTWLDRLYSRDWDAPLQVALYPVNADGSEVSEAQLRKLGDLEVRQLESFFQRAAQGYDLPLNQPLRFTWAAPLSAAPPLPPEDANVVSVMGWSLKLRWFAWRVPDPPGPSANIRLFLLYHDPQQATVLPHSTGLEKGLVGIAHLFASPDMARANLVIVAHEVLHTLSATDKYDFASNQPRYPDGYADPEQTPRHPQTRAELMAGRMAVSDEEATQADSLQQVVIGPLTAREIGWSAP